MSGVLQIITTLQRGGAQKIALRTASALHTQSTPHVLISGDEGTLQGDARQLLGARFIRLPELKREISPRDDWIAIRKLRKLIRRFMDHVQPPIVVHTHSSKAGVLGRLAARGLKGVSVVHTVHGFGIGSQGPAWEKPFLALERLASQPNQTLVFVSTADREQSNALGIGIGHRKTVIRAGINPQHFHPSQLPPIQDSRTQLGIPSRANVALVVGNFKPQKDPLVHVDILAAWHKINPHAHLLFLGDGPLKDKAIERANQHAVRAQLTLPGELTDIRPALSAANICLLASQWEGLPCSLLESLAAGLPAVFRDVGYGNDLDFGGDRCAALPASSNPDAFVTKLEQLSRLKRAALEIPTAFTEQGMLDDLRELYDQCFFYAKLESGPSL